MSEKQTETAQFNGRIGGHWAVFDANGGIVCRVCTSPIKGETEATARLLAAAPSLLRERDELKARVKHLEAVLAENETVFNMAVANDADYGGKPLANALADSAAKCRAALGNH